MSASVKQSTRHIMMVEPAAFFSNPETRETNVYQAREGEQPDNPDDVFIHAVSEFKLFRDLLVRNGVIVTTALGHEGSPDMIFPNWSSTHANGRMVLYPMMSENRRAERAPEIIEILKRSYPDVLDLTDYENKGLFLEARGSVVCDRVNRVGYVALSPRTSKEMAEIWAKEMDYELEVFETESHTGKPVYHTDLVMHIGSTYAAICADCITPEHRERVLNRLKSTHDVVELTMAQLQSFCGNALEVEGKDGDKMLAMSTAAYNALTIEQIRVIENHFVRVLHSPLDTLEKYGGGSARCTLMELY
ncbi:MAG: arginine deiminase-related protein [Pseudomonadota bacterium]